MRFLYRAIPVALFCMAGLAAATGAQARDWQRVRFLVLDPATRRPLPGGRVTIEDESGRHPATTLAAGLLSPGPTPVFDVASWQPDYNPYGAPNGLVLLAAGSSVVLQTNTQPPVQEIYIRVTASRLQLQSSQTASGVTRTNRDINTFVNKTSSDARSLTQGQPSVASDSNGQQHVRGEHADISYVVDGVPLPDTLSGRQGAIVVPSTINSLEMLTGAYAPEFGGQTAAILDITTLPGAAHSRSDIALQGGSYDTTNGTFTAVGPLGKRANYVVNLGATRTLNAMEPQQPDNQTAHNAGSDQDYFTKLRFTPGRRDILTLTLTRNPGTMQINNRTGLPESYANVGQGFGFLGLRDANGVRPDITPATAGLLGAAPMLLPSQEAEGMDITQREVNEFGILSWRRQLSAHDSGLLSLTFLHAGQDINNHNPAVNMLDLPIDNSIEYNPIARRNIHHVQVTGSYTSLRGPHTIKAGVLLDDQNGNESYQITPTSRLALDELAALSPNLAPAGAVQTNAQGQPVLDVNGNPVYNPASGTIPVVQVHRSGFYRAAYLQDTWRVSRPFTVNYGVRADWFKQTLNTGQAPVDTVELSPRLNFSWALDRRNVLRWSYNRLFNTPPLAEGAIVGEPIQPELLNQYDVSWERQAGPGQVLRLAYFYKQIHNQVDTGLLIPGSQIGLYSAVNFQYGGVHGLEFSYDLTPRNGVGWDGYLNYTLETAKPNGVDNTGAPVPNYNDHDQRHTVGLGLAYLWRGGASAAMTVNYGSGLASSSLIPDGPRTPRTDVDLRLTTGPRLFHGRGGIGLDVTNLLDARTVMNFQSAFSGTRFMQGRRVLLTLFGNF